MTRNKITDEPDIIVRRAYVEAFCKSFCDDYEEDSYTDAERNEAVNSLGLNAERVAASSLDIRDAEAFEDLAQSSEHDHEFEKVRRDQ